jgi:hypothetical protein
MGRRMTKTTVEAAAVATEPDDKGEANPLDDKDPGREPHPN